MAEAQTKALDLLRKVLLLTLTSDQPGEVQSAALRANDIVRRNRLDPHNFISSLGKVAPPNDLLGDAMALIKRQTARINELDDERLRLMNIVADVRAELDEARRIPPKRLQRVLSTTAYVDQREYTTKEAAEAKARVDHAHQRGRITIQERSRYKAHITKRTSR